jgi:hypothetical protein
MFQISGNVSIISITKQPVSEPEGIYMIMVSRDNETVYDDDQPFLKELRD